MGKIIELDMDESIKLPPTCDSMPEELRNQLMAALTVACDRYKCGVEDLHWNVRIDKKTNNPYISVKKR